MMSSPASRRRRASIWTDQASEPLPDRRSTRGEKRMALSSSVTGRRTGWPARIVDPEHAAAGADRDQLDGAPGGLLPELMAALCERCEGCRRQSAALVIQRIGQPLMVKARHRDSRFRRQPEIDDID